MSSNRPVSDVAFSPAVKGIQERKGSRKAYERLEDKGGWCDRVTAELGRFIAARDSFYLATASADGQPYVQHRGGKRGFLKVLDEKTLAFADFRGNRQYITLGNLSENAKAFVFLMDYPNRRRIKLWGRARAVDDDKLLTYLHDADHPGKPEQAIVFTIEAWDVNCPQHIEPRYSEDEIREAASARGTIGAGTTAENDGN
jgi:predicted pyridoxine 5'-phosphate oxidase superfamily flavin-nucleotide-binding protein